MLDRLRKRFRAPQERAGAVASGGEAPPPPSQPEPEDDHYHAPDAVPEDLVGKKVGFHGKKLLANRRGAMRINLYVTYTPTGGSGRTATRKVTIPED